MYAIGATRKTFTATIVTDSFTNWSSCSTDSAIAEDDEVQESNSVGIEVGVEAETDVIIEKAKVSVVSKYEHEWVTRYAFKQDLKFDVTPAAWRG